MNSNYPVPEDGVTELIGLPAPAKINLFLHVIGRRSDGYHLLQSVFALVDWADQINLFSRAGGVSRSDLNADFGLPSDDLMVRAAQALQRATGCTKGVHMELTKRVPMQAGLGGGSSDAATCLIGLNRLWDLKLSRQALLDIAAGLGADVPFFIGGQNAWVEGIGEQLTPLALPPTRVTILKPSAGVSTSEIFSSSLLTRDTKPATMLDFAEHRVAGDTDWQPYSFGRNDLQAPAVSVCHEIQAAINWLAQKKLTARMTGSGSAVFAVHADSVDVSEAPAGWLIHQGNVLKMHPLAHWIS